MATIRSRRIAVILIVMITLLVAIPLTFAIRVKSFNEQIDRKNETIKELQEENKKVNDQLLSQDAEVLKLNDEILELKKERDDLKKKLGKKAASKIEVEKVTETTTYASEPITEETQEQTEYVTEEPTTTEPVTEAPATEESEEPTTEETVTEEDTEEPYDEDGDGYGVVGLEYSKTYNIVDNHLTRSNGVVYYDGHKETWYSTNEAAGQSTARPIPGKHVAEDGTIRDADGYVCVASSDLPMYSIVMTTVGPGKVYDCGCSYGTIDVYTSW